MPKFQLAILVEFEADSYSESVVHADNLTNILLAHKTWDGPIKIVETVGPDLPNHFPNGLKEISFPR